MMRGTLRELFFPGTNRKALKVDTKTLVLFREISDSNDFIASLTNSSLSPVQRELETPEEVYALSLKIKLLPRWNVMQKRPNFK